MANPFLPKFDSSCQSCGKQVNAGDPMYSVERAFVCPECATEAGCVCKCGGFKKPDYSMCYDCGQKV